GRLLDIRLPLTLTPSVACAALLAEDVFNRAFVSGLNQLQVLACRFQQPNPRRNAHITFGQFPCTPLWCARLLHGWPAPPGSASHHHAPVSASGKHRREKSFVALGPQKNGWHAEIEAPGLHSRKKSNN